MKWLFLLLIVSCGHQEPNEKDLEDSDGDKVANAYEAELTKFQADFQPLNKTDGILSIGEEKISSKLDIAFTNFRDLKLEAFQKLTWREDKIPRHEYFSEFSRLEFKSQLQGKVLDSDKMYHVSLKFESSEELPAFLYLVVEDKRVLLAKVDKTTNIRMTGKNLQAIFNKEIHLHLSNSENDSEKLANIKAKTYRVYRFDGVQAQIHYYSKDISFRSYLESQNLHHAKVLNIEEITELDEYNKSWWYRELPNGDKALVFSTIADIKEYYLEGLQKEFNTLSRSEGSSQNAMVLKTENTREIQRVVLRIYPGIIRNRTFYDRRFVKRVERSRTQTCVIIRRTISGEVSHEIEHHKLLDNISAHVDQSEVSLNDLTKSIKESIDDKGMLFWEIQLDYRGQELSIKLKNLPSADTIYGLIESNCHQDREKKIPIHTEMDFKMAVKAYLED